MDFRSNRFTCHYEFPSVYFICYRRTIPNHWSNRDSTLAEASESKKKCRFSIKMGKYYLRSYWTYYCTHCILCIPDLLIAAATKLKEERAARLEAEKQRDKLVHQNKLYTTSEIAKELGFLNLLIYHEFP